MTDQNLCLIKGYGNGYPDAAVGDILFSWSCPVNIGKQKGYNLCLKRNGHVIYETGFVESSVSDNIRVYKTMMVSDTDYDVQVEIETTNGEVYKSNVENFSTGLEGEDWRAGWLTPATIEGAAPLFKKVFLLKDEVQRARLYICGLGYNEVFINGEKINDEYLSPAWTNYSKRVSYTAYDVTKWLVKGENVVSVLLGKGWYGKMLGIEAGILLFSLQMSITNHNGVKEWMYFDSAEGWRVNSSGPIKENSIYIGEIYDARDEKPEWLSTTQINMQANGWEVPLVAEPPQGKLVPQNLEPIRCIAQLAPVSIKYCDEERYIVDFGQNIAGLVELIIDEAWGVTTTIRYSELIDEKGELNTVNLRTAQARDVYISGGAKSTYIPRFTYHGFRYVEIKGYTKELTIDCIKALAIRNDVSVRGTFKSSNELINRIQTMCEWTESNNLHGVPTDCPQRDERLGWLNDLTVRAEGAMYNFDLYRFYMKYLTDIADEQRKQTGAITDTVPYIKYGNCPADPVSSSYLIIGWQIYLNYGNKDVLKHYYNKYASWTNYLARSTTDGIVNYSYFGDWAAPIAGAVKNSIGAGAVSSITPGKLMSTGFLYYNAQLMSKIAKILDKKDDANKWIALAEKTKTALNKEFYQEDTGNYAGGSQGANTFMVWLGIAPDKGLTIKRIVEDIRRHDMHLTTGNICTRYALEVLTENGYVDVAYDLVTQTTYPSWGYMLKKGATTTWERWEYVDSGDLVEMASHNHPMYSTVTLWFYRYLLGIKPIEPAYRTFLIQPWIPEALTSAEGIVRTVKGEICVSWLKIGQNNLQIDVTVPFNTKCEFHIPDKWDGNYEINEVLYSEDNDVLWLSAGEYKIIVERN